MSLSPAQKVKTRLLILSDTHSRSPYPPDFDHKAYRRPLPKADVLIHCGDLTDYGKEYEFEKTFEMLRQADAELKLVIAGNHDVTLHEEYYLEKLRLKNKRGGKEEIPARVRKMWCGETAKEAGIIYLEEGIQRFELKNEGKFTVYSSPWQPEYYDWAFGYPRNIDRFNPSPSTVEEKAANPIPNRPEIDIMITHGPPKDILDVTFEGNEHVGCDHLRKAVERCKPRIHCFGHIHEGWGAERMNWTTKHVSKVEIPWEKVLEDRSAYADLSQDGSEPLRWGDETLFVNASIMNVRSYPNNAPWVVDLDLPRQEDEAIE